jgi:CheY-like chemotaxis protein
MALLDGVTVLVVDREPDLQATRTFLEYIGARVLAASDADEARALLDRDEPHLIFCAVDAIDLIAHIRRDPRHAERPVIAMSGPMLGVEHAATWDAGFDARVSRPVDCGALLSVAAMFTAARRGMPGAVA